MNNDPSDHFTSNFDERQRENIARRVENQALLTLKRWCRKRPGADQSYWILAISGGPDSVALLHVLLRRLHQPKLILAHMNHHARDGSDKDEQFVRKLASKYGLSLEVGHWQAKRSAHFEADARKARHAWLAGLADQFNASSILTAHTLDDQAETLLMRLARGTGPQGLAGIRPWRSLPESKSELVRPMLNVTKSEIMQYLEFLSADWCIDPTNTDTENQTRAWIRHVLMPMLQGRLNPECQQALANLAAIVQEEQDGLDKVVKRLASKVADFHYIGQSNAEEKICQEKERHGRLVGNLPNEVVRIDVHAYRKSGPAWIRRRILRHLWTRKHWPMQGMTSRHWRQLDQHLKQNSSTNSPILALPCKIIACFENDRTVFIHSNSAKTENKNSPLNCDIRIVWNWPETLELDEMTLVAKPMPEIPTSKNLRNLDPKAEAVFDESSIKPPFFLRHPQTGDTFDPLGMHGHHQKIVDFLRIHDVSNHEKKNTWLLCDQTGIIWVVGHRIADRVKVTSATSKAWHVGILKPEHES